jgi:hypothetical protein
MSITELERVGREKKKKAKKQKTRSYQGMKQETHVVSSLVINLVLWLRCDRSFPNHTGTLRFLKKAGGFRIMSHT